MLGSGDLAILTAYFNPCNYKSRERNLFLFLDQMRAYDLPVFVAELVFPGQHHVLEPTGNIHIIRFHASDVMWHKERLINLAAEQVPPRYIKLAWIDADVLFPNKGWYDQASGLLDSYRLVQLFDRVTQQDNYGNEVQLLYGLAAHIALRKPAPFKFDTSRTWPGLAWAARRDLLRTHGLLDVFILGSADTYMSLAAYGPLDEAWEWHVQRLAPRIRKTWRNWAKAFFHDVRGNVGFVPTHVLQLGHGRKEDRKYVERLEILARHDFDPVKDIAPGSQGEWQWSSRKPNFHAEVRAYFEERKEDL